MSTAQEKALLDVYTGQKGGPVADLAKLVGKVVSVQKVPITFTVSGGNGTIKVGNAGYAELEPYKSATGATTTLANTVFSTVPGAPVFVGKANEIPVEEPPGLGKDIDIKGHNALQSTFVFDASERPARGRRRCRASPGKRSGHRGAAPPGATPARCAAAARRARR